MIVPEKWVEGGQEITTMNRVINQKTSIVAIRTYLNMHGASYFYSPRKLLKEIRQFKPDLIHIHEEPWSLSAFQTILIKKAINKESKIIIDSAAINLYKKPVFKNIEAFVTRNADLFFARNSECKQTLEMRGCNKPIYFLSNGVDEDLFYPINNDEEIQGLKDKYNIPKDKKIIGFIGRMIPEKGIDLFVEAANNLIKQGKRDFHFIMVGNGPAKEAVYENIRKENLSEFITILNKVPSQKMPDIMNIIDLLVLPSYSTPTWKEQFGRVLVEAMSCGKAVIGSESGGIPEVIGDLSYIFKERDANDLASKIMNVMGNHSALTQAQFYGRQRVNSLFSWKSISSHYIKVLKGEKLI